MKRNRETFAMAGLVGLGAVVALFGLLVVVMPQRSKVHSLDASITSAQAQLVVLHARKPTLPAVRAAELFQLARAMPNGGDMPGILLGLARAAGASSVTLTSVTPAVPTTLADGSTAVPLTVAVGGSWSGLAAFLKTLRDQVAVHGAKLDVAGRLFIVDGVQVSSGTVGGEVQATLTLSAFTYGVPAPPAPIAAPGTTTTTPATTTTTTPAPGAAVATGVAGSGG